MAINSLSFILFFVVLSTFYYGTSVHKQLQNYVLLIANYVFYGFVNWRMAIFLFIVVGIAYIIGLEIEKNGNRKKITAVGILLAVGLLAYFKYFNFFIKSFCHLLENIGLQANYHVFNIVVPVGISFFTFRIISYLVEIYRGNVNAEKDFVVFSNYISFFPAIASGPIDRPNTFLPQLHKARVFNYDLAVDGTRQILWGLFKKMVIADNIANVVDGVWDNYVNEPASSLFWTACLYSIQIYADFSGYSDMSIGVGKLMGFNIMKNFEMPYFSRNMSEFWRKWHISLTSWLTDYIYKPLGGSRCSKYRHLTNLMIVFLISGLWHGADWSFVAWGGFHGVLLIALVLLKGKKYNHYISKNRMLPSFHELICMLVVFLFSSLGWIFFRADSMPDACSYIVHMLCNNWLIKPDFHVKIIVFILVMFILEWITRTKEHPLQMNCGQYMKWGFYLVLTYMIIYHQGQSTDFIYCEF